MSGPRVLIIGAANPSASEAAVMLYRSGIRVGLIDDDLSGLWRAAERCNHHVLMRRYDPDTAGDLGESVRVLSDQLGDPFTSALMYVDVSMTDLIIRGTLMDDLTLREPFRVFDIVRPHLVQGAATLVVPTRE